MFQRALELLTESRRVQMAEGSSQVADVGGTEIRRHDTRLELELEGRNEADERRTETVP